MTPSVPQVFGYLNTTTFEILAAEKLAMNLKALKSINFSPKKGWLEFKDKRVSSQEYKTEGYFCFWEEN